MTLTKRVPSKSGSNLVSSMLTVAFISAAGALLIALLLFPVGVPALIMIKESHPGSFSERTWMSIAIAVPIICTVLGFVCGIAMGLVWNVMLKVFQNEVDPGSPPAKPPFPEKEQEQKPQEASAQLARIYRCYL